MRAPAFSLRVIFGLIVGFMGVLALAQALVSGEVHRSQARELLEELSRRTAMMFAGPDRALHERIRAYLEKHK